MQVSTALKQSYRSVCSNKPGRYFCPHFFLRTKESASLASCIRSVSRNRGPDSCQSCRFFCKSAYSLQVDRSLRVDSNRDWHKKTACVERRAEGENWSKAC